MCAFYYIRGIKRYIYLIFYVMIFTTAWGMIRKIIFDILFSDWYNLNDCYSMIRYDTM